MLEPISTITNLAFVLIGFITYKRSKYVGLVTIILGIASGGWHWAMNPFWHTLDFGMIYFMLFGLINYSLGSHHTFLAFLTATATLVAHFLLPSNILISGIAILLLLALVRRYPAGSILIIVSCFILWISTNIPYLHQWSLPFWSLDVLHGISHICASIGIYKVVTFKPVTFNELVRDFKSAHLAKLNETLRTDFERVLDDELKPVFGNRTVDAIDQKDISNLLDKIALKQKSLDMVDVTRSALHQILEFASGRGIRHNLVVETVK